MTKFANKTFSVPLGDSPAYRDNWAATFGKRESQQEGSTERWEELVDTGPTAEALLTEALAYVRAAIRVPGGPADELAGRISAFLERR